MVGVIDDTLFSLLAESVGILQFTNNSSASSV